MSRLFISKILCLGVIFLSYSHLIAFQKPPKVVVVGAGFAGLTCAYRLQQQGFDVDVYEARNRVGGRVFSVNVAGHIAELGGQNIRDGGACKNILALVKELELKTKEGTKLFHLSYYDNDKTINILTLLKEHNFSPENLLSTLEAIGQKSQNMQQVLQILFKENDPLYKFCSTMLAGYEGATTDKLSSVYTTTLYHILLGGLSSTHQGNHEKPILEHMWIDGGNAVLAEKLAERLNEKVHLNYALCAASKNSAGSYILTFQNGERVIADILVLTIPCPVYTDVEIDKSVIPSDKKAAIATLQYGTCAKILVPVMRNAETGQYTNGRIVTFFNNDGHVLNMYYTDNYGQFSAKTIGETYQKDLPLVEKFYSLQSTTAPVAAQDQLLASYSGPVGHSWPNDPFAKGSYSCIGPGQEDLFTSLSEVKGETTKTLFAPIDDTLFFAGEHTSILLDVGGTMEAAVESGERIARTIEKSTSNK